MSTLSCMRHYPALHRCMHRGPIFLFTVVVGLLAERFFQKIPWSLTKIVAEKRVSVYSRDLEIKTLSKCHIRLRTEDTTWQKLSTNLFTLVIDFNIGGGS